MVVKGTGNGTQPKESPRTTLLQVLTRVPGEIAEGMLTLSFKFMNDPAYASEYFRAADEKILTTRSLSNKTMRFSDIFSR